MKAIKRVRLGLAMLRFAASLDLTFFCSFAAIIILKTQPIVTSTIKHLMHRTKKEYIAVNQSVSPHDAAKRCVWVETANW